MCETTRGAQDSEKTPKYVKNQGDSVGAQVAENDRQPKPANHPDIQRAVRDKRLF
jgi:hypothetical protein